MNISNSSNFSPSHRCKSLRYWIAAACGVCFRGCVECLHRLVVLQNVELVLLNHTHSLHQEYVVGVHVGWLQLVESPSAWVDGHKWQQLHMCFIAAGHLHKPNTENSRVPHLKPQRHTNCTGRHMHAHTQ